MKTPANLCFGAPLLDRAEPLRNDPVVLEELSTSTDARFVVLWRGQVLSTDRGVSFLGGDDPFLRHCSADQIFLGRHDGIAYFAATLDDWSPESEATSGDALGFGAGITPHPLLPQVDGFAELRSLMANLSPLDAESTAVARALTEWHRSHKFCARCGAPSSFVAAGWRRDCPACQSQHFPRTDPVVIMVVTHGNETLIGRSHPWPERMYSCLAGFVEPGETIEAAVRREVFEETGVSVGEVSYVASQPWPFPMSLMIGCHAKAKSKELTVDERELEDALWISREALARCFHDEDSAIRPPREGSIASFLLTNWVAGTLW